MKQANTIQMGQSIWLSLFQLISGLNKKGIKGKDLLWY
jgi:hypothetical protein